MRPGTHPGATYCGPADGGPETDNRAGRYERTGRDQRTRRNQCTRRDDGPNRRGKTDHRADDRRGRDDCPDHRRNRWSGRSL